MDLVRGTLQSWIAVIGVAAGATGVRADMIAQGQTIPLSGTTVQERPELGGPYVAWEIVSFTGEAGAYSGLVEVGLIDIGMLIQTYRLVEFDDAGVGYAVEALVSEPQWGPGPIDVDYLTDSPGDVGAATATWPLKTQGVRYDFISPVVMGQAAHEVFVVSETDLFDGPLLYAGAHVVVRDPLGGITAAAFPSYATYIPAPGAALFLGVGVPMAIRRRRRVAGRMI